MDAQVSMGQAMSRVTMHVRITDARQYAWRQRMGIGLMKLAAVAIGCNIEVDIVGSWPPIPDPLPDPPPPPLPPKFKTHNAAAAAKKAKS